MICWCGNAPAITWGRLSTCLRACRRSEEHTSELQSHSDLVCRLLLEKKKKYLERITYFQQDDFRVTTYQTLLHSDRGIQMCMTALVTVCSNGSTLSWH